MEMAGRVASKSDQFMVSPLVVWVSMNLVGRFCVVILGDWCLLTGTFLYQFCVTIMVNIESSRYRISLFTVSHLGC